MNKKTQAKFGMIGLGTMGRNLLLNMADSDYSVAGYDKNAAQISLLEKESEGKPVQGFTDLKKFIQQLAKPRAIMMLVPAGKIVDSVINDLTPLLDKGDLIIDGGNSKFTDTDVRATSLEKQGIHFFGMGISGGSEGARKGPSMMPGGHKEAYQVVKKLLEDVSAKVNGEPCVTYIGPGASGHFVKMVHNGIEYAIMQLIAEAYDIMKDGLGLNNQAIHQIFKKWNEGRLQSFLIEITRDIFAYKNPGDKDYLLDKIKDIAKSKGTGKWTSQFAMDLNCPIPSIDVSVSMRDLSKYKTLRTQLNKKVKNVEIQQNISSDSAAYTKKLEEAFYFSMISIYAQGMHLLSVASDNYNYDLNLAEVSKIWRGGCIIRSQFLEEIYTAYNNNTKLEHLFADEPIETLLQANYDSVVSVVNDSLTHGFSTPVFAASLNYFNAMHTHRMPTNLIQAQRDYFGAHSYELTGKEGVFRTKWNS